MAGHSTAAAGKLPKPEGQIRAMGEPAAGDGQGIEADAHAFVVKVWREDGGAGAHRGVWRGYITHVTSGRRRYVTRLSELDLFIALYLRALHVRLPLFWRIYQWL